MILTEVLLRNLEFEIELYLARQIPKNTDRVISGLILTEVLLRNLEFEIELYLYDRYLRIQKVLPGLVLIWMNLLE